MSDESRTEAEWREEVARLRRRIGDLEQYRAVVEDSPGLVCRFLPDSEIVFVNAAYCEYFGKTREELVGRKFTSLIPEADRQAVLDRILSLTVETPSMTHEHKVTAADGQVRWQRWTNRALFDEQGRAVLFQFFGEDITEGKQALEETRQLARFPSENPNPVMRVAKDGKVLYANKTSLSLLDNWKCRVGETFPENQRDLVSQALMTGKPLASEVEAGDVIYAFTVAPVQEGNFVNLYGLDITERKKAEKELRDSRDLLEKTFRSLDSAVFILDCEKPPRIVDCNPAALDIFGYAKSEMLGRTTDFLHVSQETLLEFQKALYAAVETQGHLSAFEFRMKRKDGRIFPTEHSVCPLQNDGGDRIGWVSVIRDITEHKRTLETIRENQTLIQGILDCTSAVIVVRDIHGKYVLVNKEAENVLGMDSSGIIGKTPYDVHGRDHADKILSDDKKVIESGQLLYIEDQLNVKGEIRTFLGTKFPLLDAAQKPYAVCTVAADVTDRKKAEQALRESEEKYRTLVESAGEAIATIDVNGVFTFMNETAAKRLGGVPRDFVGKTMWDLFPKDVADRQVASVQEVIKTGRRANVIMPTKLGGQLRWYSTTIQPLKDPSLPAEQCRTAMIVARDIHELIQAQEEVRILSSAVEQSIDGVAIGDVESRLLYVNEAFAHMHGYSRQEMVGMKTAKLYAQNQIDRYDQIFARIRESGSYAGEAWHTKKDGTLFPCYISVTMVRNDRGEATGTVAVCRDMAESRQKEADLTKFRAQMARAEQLASLGTLSATVAHQITQPLTVIRLSLDNVLDELMATSVSSTAIRRLQDSISQVSNITSIINRFRHFARRSSDTRFGEVSLCATAERVVRLLEESARQARVSLRIENMDKLPSASMNETDLEQLFFALLENAIQAADGTKAHHVVISALAGQGQVELRFSDDCGGIAPENLERLFEPFFTTKPRGHGTGLGLCIVQDVVARAGGHIRIESKLGRGTTFFVTLPVKEGATS